MRKRKRKRKKFVSKFRANAKDLVKLFRYENPQSVLLEEVVMPDFRADLLEFVFGENDKAYSFAYEVKADTDNLKRLETELLQYVRYFNFVFVLTTEKHQDNVLAIIANNSNLERVGVRVCKQYAYEKVRLAYYRDLTESGLNTEWITDNNRLSQYEYLLEEIWGCGLYGKK